MALGQDEADRLAHALTLSDHDFDAAERAQYRAEWAEEGTAVRVEDLETGETRTYTADDLVIAASDQEVANARRPGEE